MCLCLLTDGTKQNLTRGQRERERWRERGDDRRLLGHLEAAHAIKRDVREDRRDAKRRKLGWTDRKIFRHFFPPIRY